MTRPTITAAPLARRRLFLATGAGALVAAVAAPRVRAQGTGLPSGPIRIMVGFPPGGGTDAMARVVGQKFQTLWGNPVIIENRGGAAGVIAADQVSKAAPDGNTLLMAHINSHALGPALNSIGQGTKINYDVASQFSPIGLVGVTPNLLIGHPNNPARTVADVVAACKAKPGRISFASAGAGSAQHFALEMFKLQAKVFALHIPYRGSGPALTDLMGQQVDFCFETMTSATPHVKSTKVVAIAQTRLKRAKGHPSVPTMEEAGFKGFEATTWYGLVGPGRLPPGMVQRMNDDLNKVLAMPDVQERMDAFGAEDGGGSAQKFADFIRTETAKWTQVAKQAGVKIDT